MSTPHRSTLGVRGAAWLLVPAGGGGTPQTVIAWARVLRSTVEMPKSPSLMMPLFIRNTFCATGGGGRWRGAPTDVSLRYDFFGICNWGVGQDDAALILLA